MPDGPLDKVKSTVNNIKSTYDAGNRETEGLGGELASRAEMNRLGEKALGDLSIKQEPSPTSKRPLSEWEKVHPMPYGSRPGEKRIDVTDALKPLGSYKTGTPYVPKTGMYQLHEGEAVVPKEKNTMNAADAMAGIAGKAKAPKKEIKSMVHTKTHNGKHIVTHHHHHPEHHPDETHAFDNMSDVHDHMENHAGTPNDGEAASMGASPDMAGAAGASAPAPLTASPSPAPPPTGM
jgi:hypothetical protein